MAGIIAAVFAVQQLIETITIIGPPGSFISPGGSMNFYVGGPLFVVFFLALGIALSLEQPTASLRSSDRHRYRALDSVRAHDAAVLKLVADERQRDGAQRRRCGQPHFTHRGRRPRRPRRGRQRRNGKRGDSRNGNTGDDGRTNMRTHIDP